LENGRIMGKLQPVAWMHKESGQVFAGMGSPIKPDDFIPLYTHPAEHDLGIAEAIGFEKGYKVATAKTLTDEEIDNAITEAFNRGARFGYAEGLKKASEK